MVAMKGRNPEEEILNGTQIHFSFFFFSEVKRMASCVIENLLTFLL